MKKYLMKKLGNKKAEGYVDSGVKVLIAVVIGALVLGGIYVLFSDTLLPTVQDKVESLFDFAGGEAPATPMPTLISFTVNNNEVQAEEHMTWAEWIDSGYNTKGLLVKGTTIGNSNYYTYLVYGSRATYVHPGDEIMEGVSYRIIIEFPEIPD